MWRDNYLLYLPKYQQRYLLLDNTFRLRVLECCIIVRMSAPKKINDLYFYCG